MYMYIGTLFRVSKTCKIVKKVMSPTFFRVSKVEFLLQIYRLRFLEKQSILDLQSPVTSQRAKKLSFP